MRTNILLILILLHTACKDNQQTWKVAASKERVMTFFNQKMVGDGEDFLVKKKKLIHSIYPKVKTHG